VPNIIKNFFLVFTSLLNLIISKNRNKLITIVLGMILVMILEILSIGVIYPLINIIFDPKYLIKYDLFFLKKFDQKNILLLVLFFFVFVFLLKNILIIIFIIYKSTFLQNFLSDLRLKLYDNYLNQDFKNFLKKDTPEIIRNIQVEATVAMRSLDAYLSIFAELFILVGIISFLFYLAPIPTLSIIISFSIFSLVYVFTLKKKIFELGKERVELDSIIIREIEQGLGNYKEILIYNIKNIFLKKFSDVAAKYNKNMLYISVITQSTRVLLEQFGIFIITIVTFILLLKQNNLTDTIPLLGSYVYAFFRILPSINKIILNFQAIINAKHSISFLNNEIARLLKNRENDLSDVFSKINKPNLKKYLFIENLTYHNEKKIIFKNLNLLINKGEKIGIMGQSGSGKSTFLNLVMGLLKPQTGSIKYEGVDIAYMRKKIGYVSQNIYIMKDSLKNNITLRQGSENIDMSKLNSSISAAGLMNFINSLKEGLDTIITENAGNISGGELQRIIIARSLYFSKEILIFDEFTSSLDLKAEELILTEINKINKTMIIVSHKLSSLKYCDKIYELNNQNLNEINAK
jgi:ATP-binding cassette subfamily B protein